MQPAITPYFSELLSHLELCPFVELPLQFDHQKCFAEALSLVQRFVPHRNYKDVPPGEPTWKSICLRGLHGDETKTLYHTDYNESEPVFDLTDIAEQCPATLEFLREFTDIDRCGRIRFMLLEPGAKIHVHRDQAQGQTAIGINVALNNPEGCRFFIETDEKGTHQLWTREIPFRPGIAMLINVGKFHYVENNSNEPRIHMIVDGPIRFSQEQLVALARMQNGVSSEFQRQFAILRKRALQEIPISDSTKILDVARTLGVEREVVKDQVQILLLEPEGPIFAGREELINMSTASLFPLHVKLTKMANLDQAIVELRNSGARRVAILSAGLWVPRLMEFLYEVFRQFGQMKRLRASISGHLLDFPDQEWAPHFHRQLILLDLESESGSEFEFGQIFAKNQLAEAKRAAGEFPAYERSVDNFHDNYTPYWLKPQDGAPSIKRFNFGSSLIAASLRAGRPVLNLDSGLRKVKRYAYPEKEDSKELKEVRAEISGILEMTKNRVYVFNNEPETITWLPKFKPELMLSVSAGFKPLAIVEQYWGESEPKRFDILDYSCKSLAYLKDLSQAQNFDEILECLIRHCHTEVLFKSMKREEIRERLQQVLVGGFSKDPGRLLRRLGTLRKASFSECDFVFDPEPILARLRDRPKFIFWHSNAWFNKPVMYLESLENLRQRYRNLGILIGQYYEVPVWSSQAYFEILIGHSAESAWGLLTEGQRGGETLDLKNFRQIYHPSGELHA